METQQEVERGRLLLLAHHCTVRFLGLGTL